MSLLRHKKGYKNKLDTVRAFTPRLFHIFCWRRLTL